MGTMTETGTERRVDELSKRVDFGFEQLSKRVDFGYDQIDRRFEQVDIRFEEVSHRFDRVESDLRELRSDVKNGFESVQRTIIWFFGSMIISIIAGVVVLLLSQS